jgi:hypothetical protein
VYTTSRHVKATVVVAEGGRIDASTAVDTTQKQLAWAIESVANDFPINNVLGVINGNAREELKGGGGKEIVITDSANRGVGIESWQNGIGDCHGSCVECGYRRGLRDESWPLSAVRSERGK